MKAVFIVQYERIISEDDEEVKVIGIYSTKVKAEKALEDVKMRGTFKDYSGDFYISKYELDKAHWTEGFGFN